MWLIKYKFIWLITDVCNACCKLRDKKKTPKTIRRLRHIWDIQKGFLKWTTLDCSPCSSGTKTYDLIWDKHQSYKICSIMIPSISNPTSKLSVSYVCQRKRKLKRAVFMFWLHTFFLMALEKKGEIMSHSSLLHG